jgi:hypothetical protein
MLNLTCVFTDGSGFNVGLMEGAAGNHTHNTMKGNRARLMDVQLEFGIFSFLQRGSFSLKPRRGR